MASQLENEVTGVKRGWGVCEQKTGVNSVREDYWTDGKTTIASKKI